MPDLETFFSKSNLNGWGLREFAALTIDGEARGVVLRWSELMASFQAMGPDSKDSVWRIYCDVLILDADITLTDELEIFARQIVIDEHRDIEFVGAATRLRFIVKQVSGPSVGATLATHFETAESVDVFENVGSDPFSPIMVVTITNDGSRHIEPWNAGSEIVDIYTTDFEYGEMLRLGTTTALQLATLIGDKETETAMDQLQWVAALADINPAARALAGQARSQLGWLIQRQLGTNTVPPLDFQVYADGANAQKDILIARDAAYQTFANMEWTDGKWLEQGTLTVGLQSNEAVLATHLETNADDALKKSKEASLAAQKQLNVLRSAFSNAETDFEVGIKIWKRDQTVKASIELAVNIIKFGVEVGKLASAAGGGAAAEGAGAKEGAGEEQIEGAGEEGAPKSSTKTKGKEKGGGTDKLKSIGSALGGVGSAGMNVVGSVQKVIQIGKTADQMEDMSKQTLSHVEGDMKTAFGGAQLSGLNVVTGGRQVWDYLRVHMDDIFDQNESTINDIGGGGAFRVALHNLLVGAQAMCSTRLAVAAARDAAADAKLRRKSAEAAVHLVENYTKQLHTDLILYRELRQMAFGRILDAKRAIYFELQNYMDAIRYFTLDPNFDAELPDITGTVDDFVLGCAKISGYELAIQSVSPTPQEMNGKTLTLEVSNAERESETHLVFQIGLDEPKFERDARMRLDRMDLEFFDADGSAIVLDTIYLTSNGTYWDRYADGTPVQFTGTAWDKLIQYEADNTTSVSSGTYSRFGDLIFKPTPYTIWTVRFIEPGINSRVHKVTMTLWGEVSNRSAMNAK